MDSEVRNCQNCKNEFTIKLEDFLFYEKMKVPPPTWCPECRMIRRMVFRNLRFLYKRNVFGSENEVYSAFASDLPLSIHDEKAWVDQPSPMKDREYDFSRPFFEQFRELMHKVPWPSGYNRFSINSEFCNNVYSLKNCYLVFNAGYSEDCYYGTDIIRSKNSVDLLKVVDSILSYELFDCEKCYRAFYSTNCKECVDVYFSSNLVDCHDCVGCINLKHKHYYIFNQPYSKKKYFEKLKEFNLGSFTGVSAMKAQTKTHFLKFPHRFMSGFQNDQVVGDYVSYSKNCSRVFYSRDLEDSSYCQFILFAPGRNSYDMSIAGGELCYEIAEMGGYQSKFSWYSGDSKLGTKTAGLQYSMFCFDSMNLFGCVGLRKKSYCILNKQYSKEEYEKILPRIIEHMGIMPYKDVQGRVYRYGEFFPPDLSPFAYNETIAQDYFPLTKEGALARGYRWREGEGKKYRSTVSAVELPDHIKDTDDSVLKEIIECSHSRACSHQCIGAFKIIPQELQLYRELNIPLPRLCHECRYEERASQRNPLRLWHRSCMCAGEKSDNGVYTNQMGHFHKTEHCINEFETSYAPERPEIVYCEQCYQAEVI